MQEVMAIHTCSKDYSEVEVVEERDFVRVKDQRLVEVKKAAVTDPEHIALSHVLKNIRKGNALFHLAAK